MQITLRSFVRPLGLTLFVSVGISLHPFDHNTLASQSRSHKTAVHKTAAPKTVVPKTRSQEWKLLPKQRKEVTDEYLAEKFDSLGFEKAQPSRKPASGRDVLQFPSTELVPNLGKITGSDSHAEHLTLDDLVFIESKGTIQVGEVYGITASPFAILPENAEHLEHPVPKGYIYTLTGKVRILGVQDRRFLGKLISIQDAVTRDQFLIAVPPRISEIAPIPAPTPWMANIILDEKTSGTLAVQHKDVFLDRGSNDGLRPGMVFRVYQHSDPVQKKRITRSNYVIEADLLVTQVSPQISSASIFRSYLPIQNGSRAQALTDLTDLKHPSKVDEISLKKQQEDPDDVEDLEGEIKLDSGQVGKAEEIEIESLETWQSPTPQASEETPEVTPEVIVDEAAPHPEPSTIEVEPEALVEDSASHGNTPTPEPAPMHTSPPTIDPDLPADPIPTPTPEPQAQPPPPLVEPPSETQP